MNGPTDRQLRALVVLLQQARIRGWDRIQALFRSYGYEVESFDQLTSAECGVLIGSLKDPQVRRIANARIDRFLLESIPKFDQF